jgi:hypothetical protein
MKKSELKLLQERLQKASQPPPPSKKRDDLSDELSKMFDDGTVLESQKGSAAPADTQPVADTPATQGTQGTRGQRSTPLPATASHPVAPARDFTRTANSIVREAVPAGVFTGKGKLIYDYLYSKTRGAIVPVRSVQVSRKEIMKGARVGSDKTLRENLLRLRQAGLITWDGNENVGAHAGNVYTVCLPEEARGTVATIGTQGAQGSYGTLGSAGQFQPSVPTVENTQGTQGLFVEDKDTSDVPKTSIKTNTNTDDEVSPLSDFISIFAEANQRLTGGPPRATERTQWADLAHVLVEELNEATARTEGVSSVPAFLAAHLRRKLVPKPATRKREGVQKQDPGRPAAPPPDANRRLSPDEITEQARIIAEVIEGGYTPEQAEAQFGRSFHPEDWAAIRCMALEHEGPKEGK